MSQPVLQTQGLSVSFGRLMAIDAVDLTLTEGARHALIGPNGAGKTTLINLLCGALRPTKGTVTLRGRDVTALDIAQRARQGLVRTFQINSLFPGLTPLLSLVLAVCERDGLGARWWQSLRRHTAAFDEAAHWLDHLGLTAISDVPVGQLAYGHQRLLEIALALACRPRVLLLDEPAAGLPAGESGAVLDVIDALPPDISVLLIEHDMKLVFRFARTLSVLSQGRLIAQGAPQAVAADPTVRSVYLGTT